MSGVQTLEVSAAEAGLRLDRWFKGRYPDLGYGRLSKLLRTGQVRVDGHRAKANLRLEAGQMIRVPPLQAPSAPAAKAEQRPPKLKPAEVEALQASVLYRDEWLLAINKPAGLAVQGGTGQTRHLDGLLDALKFEAGERPRLVHRLDKDTSGVLILARTAEAARSLTAAFRDKEVQKIYWAAVAGTPPRKQGTITLALGKGSQGGRELMEGGGEGAKDAATAYQLAARRGKHAAWLVLCPLTGRTHQLRAHCKALGTPILGDGKYGGRAAFLETEEGQFPAQLQLHAREAAFPHPSDGTTHRVTAPLPAHMRETWEALGFQENAGEKAASALEDWLPSAKGMLAKEQG